MKITLVTEFWRKLSGHHGKTALVCATVLGVWSCKHARQSPTKDAGVESPQSREESSVELPAFGEDDWLNLSGETTLDPVNVPQMNVVRAVTQIQITKPSCRDVETDVTTGKQSRAETSVTMFCAGTVVESGGKRFVITAAHCMASECINNNSNTFAFKGKGIFNHGPSVKGIKIPALPQEYDTTKKAFPVMDDFDWTNASKVLVARDIEFVSSKGLGGVFSANTAHMGLSNGFCGGANTKPIARATPVMATTMDMAVIDFGTGLSAYPAVTLPAEDFKTSKLTDHKKNDDKEHNDKEHNDKEHNEKNNGEKFPQNKWIGVGFSNNLPGTAPEDYFKTFQKGINPRVVSASPDCSAAQGRGVGLPFYGSQDANDSFAMREGSYACHGDSGSPVFQDILKNGVHSYEFAGVASVVEFETSKSLPPGSLEARHLAGSVTARCGAIQNVTYSSIKPKNIQAAMAKITARTSANQPTTFPDNFPKNATGLPVDLWSPDPKNAVIAGSIGTPASGLQNASRFITIGISAPTTVTNSLKVIWKAVTLSDGVTKFASQVAGQPLMAIATDGLGQRKATWKAPSLSYGYYNVDIMFPKNIQSASCLVAQYETNPLRGKTTLGSKVMTILAEGSPTFNLGAYSGNEIAVGDPVRGPGIPAGATVAIAPATRKSSTFTMSLAATATSATTGTPLIVTHTFRNRVDQKTGANADINIFGNTTLNLLPFKGTTIGASNEYYIWVPAGANTINNGSATIILNDKGCGTPTASAGRMTADTVIFTSKGPIK